MAGPVAMDELFAKILAWGKGYAVAEGVSLDVRHLLLGAMRADGGPELLARLLGSEVPLNRDLLEERFVEQLSRAQQPVTDRSLNLTPRLAEITREVQQREGCLKAEPLLARALAVLEPDEEWGKPFLANAKRYPRVELRHSARAVREVMTTVDGLRAVLAERVLGQEQAVDRVCDLWFSVMLQGKREEREAPGPRAVLTFVGPPGVGKTMLAEAMASHLGGAGKPACLRLDMSAYSGHQNHEQLVGFAKAYSGAGRGVLTGFVADNPEAFVLVDEIEKAHPNTQNIFLQVLDAGRLYENNTATEVDFSRATLVFTTNLGRELYDSPNRAGALQDSREIDAVVLEALGRDVRTRAAGETGGGLSPELLSRMAKGATVLFRHLDGLTLERIADATLRQVTAELRRSIGVSLEVDDPLILGLFVLRFGCGGDARRLTSGLRRFLYGTVMDLVHDHRRPLVDEPDQLLDRLSALRFALAPETPLPEPLRQAMAGRTHLLLVDDDPWSDVLASSYDCSQVGDRAGADEAMRKGGVDLVLLDLNIGFEPGSGGTEKGLSLLRWLRSRAPETPVYLFSESPEKRGLSTELLDRVRLEGGARGVLQKRFYGSGEEQAMERDSFFRQLAEIEAALRRQRVLEHYRRRGQLLEFDLTPRLDALGGGQVLTLEVGRLRDVTLVSAGDRWGTGWVDLPRDRLADVAGATQAKQRLQEVIRCLTDPQAMRAVGVDPPRGILLTGPPGTGKTTLARAVAGEAQVPFFALSGSEVFRKFVGESEEVVRELFARARRFAPSILFIDEVDSVGGARGSDSQQWRLSVLNELLAQMDGFVRSDLPVFVLAATNRADILDPALLRPGRFDLQIEVPNPDAEARKRIFELNLSGRALAAGVDLAALVVRTAGMSGADVKQVCKEAALRAFRNGRPAIAQEDLQEAVTTVGMGLASERPILEESVRWSTAVHEAGHALAQRVHFPDEPPTQVSILPRGRALGFVEHAGGEGYRDQTLDRLCRSVQVLLAGRAAEELVLGPSGVTAGCSNDLERATALLLQSVSNWGLDSQFGILSLSGAARGLGAGAGLGDLPKEAIDRAREWLLRQQRAVLELLHDQQAALEGLARLLVERETLYADDLAACFAEILSNAGR